MSFDELFENNIASNLFAYGFDHRANKNKKMPVYSGIANQCFFHNENSTLEFKTDINMLINNDIKHCIIFGYKDDFSAQAYIFNNGNYNYIGAYKSNTVFDVLHDDILMTEEEYKMYQMMNII